MIRAIDKWLWGYLRSVQRRPKHVEGLKHLIFCVADHFEPSRARDEKILDRWVAEYPEAVRQYRDADGRTPRHTFFYPVEEYKSEELRKLAGLCRGGHGEVEIQLHHRNDTPGGFREKLTQARDRFHKEHGLLGIDAGGKPRYGFVHGNWALCNSRPDRDWCGVNEELGILADTGCYADFTFPSAPSPTQVRSVNMIYRASDSPGSPRGCDDGVQVAGSQWPVARGRRQRTDGSGQADYGKQLLLITGPLGLNWRRRKWGVFPRLENSALDASNPPAADRTDLWVKQHIHVQGRPDWVFVKVHTHGCEPANADVMLGEPGRRMYEYLCAQYNDGRNWCTHFVTAREMANLVRAAEDSKAGNPGEYRDYEIRSPQC